MKTEISFSIKYKRTFGANAKRYEFMYWSDDWQNQLSNYQIKQRIIKSIEKKRGYIVKSIKIMYQSPCIKVITNLDIRYYGIYQRILSKPKRK